MLQRKFVLDFRAPSESFFFCLTRFKVRNESEFSVIRRKEETGKLSREILPVAVSCKDVLRVRRTPSTVSGNSDEGDGLLNLMVFLSPARTDGTRRPSGFRCRRPPPAAAPASLMIYVVGSERGPSNPPMLHPPPFFVKCAKFFVPGKNRIGAVTPNKADVSPESGRGGGGGGGCGAWYNTRRCGRALSETGHFHNKRSHARPFRGIGGQ